MICQISNEIIHARWFLVYVNFYSTNNCFLVCKIEKFNFFPKGPRCDLALLIQKSECQDCLNHAGCEVQRGTVHCLCMPPYTGRNSYEREVMRIILNIYNHFIVILVLCVVVFLLIIFCYDNNFYFEIPRFISGSKLFLILMYSILWR